MSLVNLPCFLFLTLQNSYAWLSTLMANVWLSTLMLCQYGMEYDLYVSKFSSHYRMVKCFN